jgi:uncharacterized protein
MKLHAVTGDAKHLRLAKFFIDERGRQSPQFFDVEGKARGEAGRPPREDLENYAYFQTHAPLREQKTIEGHAVRALYLIAGAIDVATATKDKSLLSTCVRLFDNCVDRRMYITGGVGSTRHQERFTFDFDLPNESAYAETCASISLMMVAHRLLNNDLNARYADVMERAQGIPPPGRARRRRGRAGFADGREARVRGRPRAA